jgi:hypothetical protein
MLQTEFTIGQKKSRARHRGVKSQENVPLHGKDVQSQRQVREDSQPLSEIMHQVPASPLQECRSPVIDRLMKQKTACALGRKHSEPERTWDAGIQNKPPSQNSTPSTTPRQKPLRVVRNRARASAPLDRHGSKKETAAPVRGGLLERLADSGLQPSALTEYIGSGGTEILFDALWDYQDDSGVLIRAELIGLLLVLVSNSFPQTGGRETELLVELRRTLTSLPQKSDWPPEDFEQFQQLPTRLCEGCVSFTAHAGLKKDLLKSPETLQAILDFMRVADFSEAHLAFAVASFIFNLCRSSSDFENTESFSASLQSGLRKDGLLSMLYADVLEIADPGSPKLAAALEEIICASLEGEGCIAGVLLVKCMESGCSNARSLAVLTLRLLCVNTQHRTPLAVSGAIGALLALLELQEEEAAPSELDGIRQALAQLCISTDPTLLTADEQLNCIGHFVSLMQHDETQLQLEGAMGLTNLLTTGDDARTLALQAGAWNLCQELLFSEVQAVRRSAAEAMCNFTAAPEILDFIASGHGDLEIQVFTSFCAVEDHGTQVAATGALAMLARNPDVALRIASGARCQRLVEVFQDTQDAGIQHRAASCLSSIFQAPGLSADSRGLIQAAFAEKQQHGGFASSEAEALAWAIVKDERDTSS